MVNLQLHTTARVESPQEMLSLSLLYKSVVKQLSIYIKIIIALPECPSSTKNANWAGFKSTAHHALHTLHSACSAGYLKAVHSETQT